MTQEQLTARRNRIEGIIEGAAVTAAIGIVLFTIFGFYLLLNFEICEIIP
jgi:hypothetical protein